MDLMSERATYSVPEWAKRLGISKQLAYQHARASGEIAGVPVICIGKRMVLSREAADRVLRGELVEA